jgi:hypothetical protein
MDTAVFIFGVILFGFGLLLGFGIGSAAGELQCIDFSKPMYQHIHVIVTFDGKSPPGGIGLESGCFRAMHTHWADHWVHLESNAPRNFTMGEFFELWGLGTTNRSLMINNESASFDQVLKDGDKVVVTSQYP